MTDHDARFRESRDATLARHADLFRRLAEAERAEALRDLPGAGSWEATVDALAEVLTTVLAERDSLRVAALPVVLLAYQVDNERACLGATRRYVDTLHDLLPMPPDGDVALCVAIGEELATARTVREDLDSLARECAYDLLGRPREEIPGQVRWFFARARGQADVELLAARAQITGHRQALETMAGAMQDIATACGLPDGLTPDEVLAGVRERVERVRDRERHLDQLLERERQRGRDEAEQIRDYLGPRDGRTGLPDDDEVPRDHEIAHLRTRLQMLIGLEAASQGRLFPDLSRALDALLGQVPAEHHDAVRFVVHLAEMSGARRGVELSATPRMILVTPEQAEAIRARAGESRKDGT